MCYVHFDGLHSVHLCGRVCSAQPVAYLCVRACVFVRNVRVHLAPPSMPTVTADPA